MNLSQAGRLEAYGNRLFWGTACAPAPIAIKVTGSGWGRGRVAEEYPTGPDREYYTEVRGRGWVERGCVLWRPSQPAGVQVGIAGHGILVLGWELEHNPRPRPDAVG